MAKTFIQRSREIPASEKATFHQVTGAGASRVKRPFFDLSYDDEQAIEARIGQFLDRAVQPR